MPLHSFDRQAFVRDQFSVGEAASFAGRRPAASHATPAPYRTEVATYRLPSFPPIPFATERSGAPRRDDCGAASLRGSWPRRIRPFSTAAEYSEDQTSSEVNGFQGISRRSASSGIEAVRNPNCRVLQILRDLPNSRASHNHDSGAVPCHRQPVPPQSAAMHMRMFGIAMDHGYPLQETAEILVHTEHQLHEPDALQVDALAELRRDDELPKQGIFVCLPVL